MGWAPLQYILRNEQYFVPEGCERNVNGTVSMIGSNHTKFKVCNDDQEQTFMMVYLIGDFMNYFCGFFVGMILDNFGTRIFRLIAQLGFSFAFLLGYLARPQKTEDFYYAFMTLLGTVSVPLFISNIQISKLFGKNGGYVVAFINGLYDAVDGFTYIPKVLSSKFGFDIHNFWLACLVASSVIMLIRTVIFMPKTFFVDPSEDKKAKNITNKELFKTTLGAWKFWIFVPWWFFMDLRAKFFLQSLVPWLDWIGDRDKEFTSRFLDIFSFMQIGAFAAAPLGSYVMNLGLKYYKDQIPDDKTRRRVVLKLELLGLGLMFAGWSFLTSIKLKNFWFILAVQIICVVVRTNMYTLWNFWVLLEYPHNAFGRVAGLLSFIVSFGTFSQKWFLQIAQNENGDPRWSLVENFLSIACLAAALQMYFNYGQYIKTAAVTSTPDKKGEKFDLIDKL